MSYKNPNILPRALSYEEKENRKKGIYDSFANYLVYCQKCKYVAKSNMYIQRAEAYIDELHEKGTVCPKCGENDWTLGYPLGKREKKHRKTVDAVAASLILEGYLGTL